MNGKAGEIAKYLLPILIASVVSYFTTVNLIQERITVVDTREQIRFEETQRRFEETQRALQRIESSVERIESESRRTLSEWAKGIDRRTGEPLPLQRQVEGR
jgi:hypothetical protein